MIEHASGALFLDPGLGKTSITLSAIKSLIRKKAITKTLIIAPLRVCHSVWPAERDKWLDFNGLKMVVLHGPKKDQLLEENADIYIINPEGLEWLLQVEKFKTPAGRTKVTVDVRAFKKLGFDLLVIDELTKFKHTNTIKFKAMKLVLSTFLFKWGLTGSPVANGLMDLFGQCYMLDQGRTLGPYISHYRLKYFVQGYDGYSWDIREGADEEIYARIKPLALTMVAEDYIKMPKTVVNNIFIDLPPKAAKIYKHMEDDLLALVDNNVVTAATAAAASMKCRQVVNGGIYLDPEIVALVKLKPSKREWVDIHLEKIEALKDLIEELQGAPLLVAYDFRHDLARLQDAFGKDVPYIGGGVSAKRGKELENAWNRGELPYLFAHPSSVAHGLNLQEAGNHVAFHSLPWDFEKYDQFIRRVRRQGNKNKRVFVHHIMARDTIDEAILMSLKMKKSGQNSFFKALKSLRDSRG